MTNPERSFCNWSSLRGNGYKASICYILGAAFIGGLAACGFAQIPGIPEPGIIMYGSARAAGDNSLITIASMTWQLNDGAGNSVTLSTTSTPPVKVVTVNGQSFYIARVPFDSRVIGTQTQTFLDAPGNSFQLKATSPTYTRQVTVNGQQATFAATNQTSSTFTFTAAERGRIEQVDLKIAGGGQSQDYANWSMQTFGVNNVDPNADPDGDGMTNAQEFAAGTNPKDALSALKAVSLQPTISGGFTITWKSIPGKTYVVEKSTDNQLQTWIQIGQPVTATGNTASFTDTGAETDVTAHYRIRTTR